MVSRCVNFGLVTSTWITWMPLTESDEIRSRTSISLLYWATSSMGVLIVSPILYVVIDTDRAFHLCCGCACYRPHSSFR